MAYNLRNRSFLKLLDFSVVMVIPAAILIDLPDPKPRTGMLKKKWVHIKEGDNLSLTRESPRR